MSTLNIEVDREDSKLREFMSSHEKDREFLGCPQDGPILSSHWGGGGGSGVPSRDSDTFMIIEDLLTH